jgi:hypothetical protein
LLLGTRTPDEIDAYIVQKMRTNQEVPSKIDSKKLGANEENVVLCREVNMKATSSMLSSTKSSSIQLLSHETENRLKSSLESEEDIKKRVVIKSTNTYDIDAETSENASDSMNEFEVISKPSSNIAAPIGNRVIDDGRKTKSLMTLRKTGLRKEYEPCNHAGPCTITSCICLRSSGFCEKFCSCSRECKHRFQGCRCRKGVCKTNMCPCFAASRECDPDLCGLCGVSIHPIFLNQVYDHIRNNPDQMESFHMCSNSNIRRHNTKRVYIGRSNIHGWGAFLAESADRNDFIMEYCGEIITQDEADRRGKIYDKTDSSFLFNLNEEVVIDATRKGNKAKYVNHSKTPNCYSKIIQVSNLSILVI